jgi:hypothetical protein
MSEKKEYKRWYVAQEDLKGMSPVKARDLVVKCFFEAQKETLARVSNHLGQKQNDGQLFETVSSIVRMAFKEMEESYDSPTKAGLWRVMERLASKASTWGTPEDVVAHHKAQIEKVLALLRP